MVNASRLKPGQRSLPIMVPLRVLALDWVRKLDEAPHRSTAFRHATLHERPGLWGNHSKHPTSAVWLRKGDEGAWEAFGAGRADPAVEWLSAQFATKPIFMVAPSSWEGPIRLLGGTIAPGIIQTRMRPEWSELPTPPVNVKVRRLTLEDEPGFRSVAPSWASRSWGDFATLIDRGIAFGVPTLDGFAALAWTYESDLEHDKIAVATAPRFQNLGLGRASASILSRSIVEERLKSPLWVTNPSNLASIALANSLGYSIEVEERLLRWTPNPK